MGSLSGQTSQTRINLFSSATCSKQTQNFWVFNTEILLGAKFLVLVLHAQRSSSSSVPMVSDRALMHGLTGIYQIPDKIYITLFTLLWAQCSWQSDDLTVPLHGPCGPDLVTIYCMVV